VPTSDALFLDRFSSEVARKAAAFVRPRVRRASKTLASALTIRKDAAVGGGLIERRRLHIPHYWARYVHDGRPAMSAAGHNSRGIFIWYKNPKQDPRDKGGYPIRRGTRRKLTADELKRDKAAGKVIIAKQVGPQKGDPFFSTGPGGGMAGFERQVAELVKKRFSTHVRRRLGRHLYAKNLVSFKL
jgi:hypothetical protein